MTKKRGKAWDERWLRVFKTGEAKHSYNMWETILETVDAIYAVPDEIY